MGRPEGAGQHRFTRGDGVGEVAPQEQVSEETCSEGEGSENRTGKKHRKLLFRLISECVMQATTQAAIYT